MTKISYARYRFPPEIIHRARWLYLRFTLSLRDVEDLLAERGVPVSYETIRRWVNHFGPMIAADLDEVHLKIDGRMVYLWRVVDAEDEVLDVLVQSKRNKHATLKLMRKLLRKHAVIPDRLVTDDFRSYRAATLDLGIDHLHKGDRVTLARHENSARTVTTAPSPAPSRAIDLDPPQTFALRADEILGNERQTVCRSGKRALQA